MYFPFWLIVIGVVAIFIYLRNKEKKQDVVIPIGASSSNEIEEETVLKVQADFEKKIQDDFLPDAIREKEIYIYKYLMFSWYEELLGKHHYDDKITQKIRKDWIDYMSALEEDATCRYLSSETSKQEEIESYIDRGRIASKKAEEIENAFASSIGKEAVDELFRIRNTAKEDFPQMILKQTLKKNSAQRLENNK